MINVGFVGCGRIADLHARGYENNPEARIYAVCDNHADRLAARKSAWGAEKAYTDYRELLADRDVDALEVLVPYDMHEEVVVAAARAGKHIACQKPMTTSLASADRMIAAAKAADVLFKVTEIYVTYPPIALAKKLIDDGAIGEPLGMRINYIASPKGGWKVEAHTYEQQVRIAAQGFGLETFDHGHHEWATAWYLLGEVERVAAWIDTLNGVVDGPATAMWKCRGNKRYGVIDFMFAPDLHIPSKYYSNDEIYQIIGSKGVIFINRGTGDMMDRPPVSLFDGHRWTHFEDVPGDWGLGFVNATHNFVHAIQGVEKPLLTCEDGREVLRFALAMMKAARVRREVYLDELEHPFPFLYSHWRRLRERRDCVVRPKSVSRRGAKLAKYAPQAHDLTLALKNRFDAAAAGEWSCLLALHLTGEGGAADERFAIDIREGRIDVRPGEWPSGADLTLHIPAGVWAAMLLGKKRIEMAIIQGLIKYEGTVEKALPLRAAFKI